MAAFLLGGAGETTILDAEEEEDDMVLVCLTAVSIEEDERGQKSEGEKSCESFFILLITSYSETSSLLYSTYILRE